MSGFTKLFSSIMDSSIWLADHATLRIWIALLAKADADGVVEGSLSAFAHQARVTPEQMRSAIEYLTSPDPESRTPDHEGRRIEAIPGGWQLLNYRAYRDRGQGKDGSRAPYYRDWRRNKRDVARNTPQQDGVAHHTEAEAEAEVPPTPKGLSDDDSREDERRAPHRDAPDLLVTEAVADEAGAFLNRYQAIYRQVRNGAHYLLKPARDHAYACKLVHAWPDRDHIDKMVELFLRREARDWRNQPGSPGQFLFLAPQCDAMLRANGIVPRQTQVAS